MYQLPKTVDSHFLVRILENNVTQEEKEFFNTWLHESEENKEEFSNVALLWDITGKSITPAPPDINVQWEHIEQRISESTINHLPRVRKDSRTKTTKKHNHSRQKKEFTAMIIQSFNIIFISSLLFWFFSTVQPTEHERKQPIVTQDSELTYYERITEKGKQAAMTLGDGTRIFLNSESSLLYPSVFSDTARVVTLNGEAYFKVQEDITPFIVLCGDVMTMVTGTEFNIRNRDNLVNVVVASGSVKTFSNEDVKGVDLKKGEKVTYSRTSGFSSKQYIDLNKELAWRYNKFFFDNTPLDEVMEEIGRYYNLKVVFNNYVATSKSLTGEFSADDFQQIISIIELTLDVDITYTSTKILIN